jgi:hypothetical protein
VECWQNAKPDFLAHKRQHALTNVSLKPSLHRKSKIGKIFCLFYKQQESKTTTNRGLRFKCSSPTKLFGSIPRKWHINRWIAYVAWSFCSEICSKVDHLRSQGTDYSLRVMFEAFLF